MTWLIARQYRTEVAVGLPIFAALLVLFFFTERSITSAFNAQGLQACLSAADPESDCMRASQDVLSRYGWLDTTMPFLNFVPALIGVIAAAPLVLEFDQRTYRLAWTQGIGRTRWFVTKLVAALLLAGVTASLLSLFITRMYQPMNLAMGRWNNSFNFAQPVFISYTLFATVLVIALGVFTRKALPTFIGGFVAFFVVRVGIENFGRPHFLPAKSVSSAAFDLVHRKDWIISQRLVDSAGRGALRMQICTPKDPSCVPPTDLVTKTVFQPDGRYWLFQGIESCIFLGAVVIMLALSTWWLSKRVA